MLALVAGHLTSAFAPLALAGVGGVTGDVVDSLALVEGMIAAEPLDP